MKGSGQARGGMVVKSKGMGEREGRENATSTHRGSYAIPQSVIQDYFGNLKAIHGGDGISRFCEFELVDVA